MTTCPVTLMLTPRQIKALEEVATHYLSEGGPAWECMQMWDEPYSQEEIEGLASEIIGATRQPS